MDVSFDHEVVESYPPVELWPGGPVVDDVGALPEPHVVDTVLTTSACNHAFSVRLWDVTLTEHPDGHGVLALVRSA